ncbi:hypothetical protein ACFV2H_47465 [Streptomyces sp. NPDC059629]|uniref:hypothetical protein n=1 Tax=Streptomyces sp. NPDC059629 TaxID=3346889 RepID=UPI0036BEA414
MAAVMTSAVDETTTGVVNFGRTAANPASVSDTAVTGTARPTVPLAPWPAVNGQGAVVRTAQEGEGASWPP